MENQEWIDRFMKYIVPVTESGCWIWIGAQEDENGLNVDGESVRPDRLSWEIHFGSIPNGQCIGHKCTVQCCVNPNHLCLVSRESDGDKPGLTAPRPALYRKSFRHTAE